MNFYNLIAPGYDELYGTEQRIKVDIIKENLNIKTNDLLLDVGCGTGISDFNCKVLGIDPSVELLKQNLGNQTILAKAENIPFKDNAFDKVISVTSMHNFDDIGNSIKEIKRVGKKDFAFSILKKTKDFDLIENEIKNNFRIAKIIDGKQDWIFICSKIFK
jgi:ubiquinone/menaquinone biosynthesis C-methylase UbiE|tara:strand:+ start:710 stop:1192 length:483 start_codon:yes stop_codon:yes gene_type:complete